MTRSGIEQTPARPNTESVACTIELIADELIALIEEFEAAISRGEVPPAFTLRLAKIAADAERLIDE